MRADIDSQAHVQTWFMCRLLISTGLSESIWTHGDTLSAGSYLVLGAIAHVLVVDLSCL